jgi:NAD+ kinase
MKVIICKNANKPDDGSVAVVTEKLREFNIEAEQSAAVNENCDLVITIGGDGTILHHGKRAAQLSLPLLGINTGRLGFMTSLEMDELEKLSLLRDKKWEISSRMLLDVTLGGREYLALNDVVFQKNISSKLPEFKVSANGTIVSEIRADGLIISTPTGSTAYALSAGGPIIEPRLACVQLTPMCAHSLFNRPMILSAENPLTVQFEGNHASHAVFASVDGEQAAEFKRGEVAVISKSSLKLDLINLGGKSFHETVGKKLMKSIK